ncbi:hypothetical protein [Phaeobacter sp. HF9A]|uniref:hypothetical protein n=1 Tax=Phaeobacter sp. HF9A TaxID=2721561 RepID=UPI0020CA5A41|nr:hypothetical protein [Phaeobacter sp. HF9A]
MGAFGVKLYCCSNQMIDDVASGELTLAYNVIGSYARAKGNPKEVMVVLPQDYTIIMLRTAFLPKTSAASDLAGLFIDHLISRGWEAAPGAMSVTRQDAWTEEGQALRRIRMGPGLLVYLDPLKKAAFLKEWNDAVLQ